MLKEKISVKLNIPYIYLPEQKMFLCSTGVLFSLAEFKSGINVRAEYERKLKESELYDYDYAKATGLLRKKAGAEAVETQRRKDREINMGRTDELPKPIESESLDKSEQTERKKQEAPAEMESSKQVRQQGKTVGFIILLFAFTALISGYISTLHTATYLYDYVDTFSAWLMSASVTAYNATAFEVSVMFKQKRRYGLTFVFIVLWLTVTLFSMATTVSVFYDRYEFTEIQLVQENKQVESVKVSAQLLQKKEEDLRQAIDFKKKDIEYRQAKMYSTNAVRKELQQLEEDLQKNLSEQQELLSSTPEAVSTETKKKESLFSFLGRVMNLEGGILEFIMSTLSAIFVNIICPMSLVAVAEISRKTVDKLY